MFRVLIVIAVVVLIMIVVLSSDPQGSEFILSVLGS